MLEVVVGSLCALAGSLLTFFFQDRARAKERAAQLRRERRSESVEALAALATALLNYRHYQFTRELLRHQGQTEDPDAAHRRRESRAQAWSAYYRAALLGAPREALELAREIVDERLPALKGTQSIEEANAKADQVRDLLTEMTDIIRHGADSLEHPPPALKPLT